jgi:dynein intermediate chain
MADRKAELERKKAKLEQLRAEKKRAEEEKKKEALAAVGGKAGAGGGMKDLRSETEDLLKQLGIETPDASEQSVKPERSDSDLTTTPGGLQEQVVMTKRPVPSLGISKVTQTNIPPRELVQYSKETQTIVCEDTTESSSNLLGEDADDVLESASQPGKSGEEEPSAESAAPVEKLPPRVLTEDECKQVIIKKHYIIVLMAFFFQLTKMPTDENTVSLLLERDMKTAHQQNEIFIFKPSMENDHKRVDNS